MAKLIRTRSLGNVREIRRSWRINIEAPAGQPLVVSAHREVINCDDDNAIIGRSPAQDVVRVVSAVAAETVELPGGVVLTGAQVALAVELFVEKWEVEDIA